MNWSPSIVVRGGPLLVGLYPLQWRLYSRKEEYGHTSIMRVLRLGPLHLELYKGPL